MVQLSPAAYLILDTTHGQHDQIISFHVPGNGNFSRDKADVAIAFEGECRLHIVPLTPVPPPSAEIDFPIEPGAERYVTTALEYQTGGEPFSVFLIAAQAQKPEIASNEEGWSIRGDGIDVSLRREPGGAIFLRDQRTAAERRITGG